MARVKRLGNVSCQQSGSFGQMRVRSSSSILGRTDIGGFVALKHPTQIHNDPERFLEYQVELEYDLDSFLGKD
jgi:hypothetical protein